MNVDYEFFEDAYDVSRFLNDLKRKGYNLKTSIISITDSMGRFTVFYIKNDDL